MFKRYLIIYFLYTGIAHGQSKTELSIAAGISVSQLHWLENDYYNTCLGCGFYHLDHFKSHYPVVASISFQQALMPERRISFLFSEKINYNTAGYDFISRYIDRVTSTGAGSVLVSKSWFYDGTINYNVISFSPATGVRLNFLHHRFNFHTLLQPEIRLVNLSTSDYINEYIKSETQDSARKIWAVTQDVIIQVHEKTVMSLVSLNLVGGIGYHFHTKKEQEITIELNALKGISRLSGNTDDLLIYRSAIELMIGIVL